jgi:hypothetical protein
MAKRFEIPEGEGASLPFSAQDRSNFPPGGSAAAQLLRTWPEMCKAEDRRKHLSQAPWFAGSRATTDLSRQETFLSRPRPEYPVPGRPEPRFAKRLDPLMARKCSTYRWIYRLILPQFRAEYPVRTYVHAPVLVPVVDFYPVLVHASANSEPRFRLRSKSRSRARFKFRSRSRFRHGSKVTPFG